MAKADNNRSIYARLEYCSNTRVRVDIMIDNFSAVEYGGFHVELGEGLDFVTDTNYPDLLEYETAGTYASQGTMVEACIDPTMSNGAFITFARSQPIPTNLNIPLISFYADKNAYSTDANTTASVVSRSNNNAYDYIVDIVPNQDPEEILLSEISIPEMLTSTEYLVGDVNNDGYINATDASCILVAMNNNFNVPVSVHSIDSHFNMFFPNAKTKESPDANKDEWIDSDDSDEIMSYYSAMSAGQTYNGYVGQVNYYETYV